MLSLGRRPLIKIANLGRMTSITITVADDRTVDALTSSSPRRA
jgi:hypothetical protein